MEYMTYFTVWALAFFLVMWFRLRAEISSQQKLAGQQEGRSGTQNQAQPIWIAPKTDIDPVCGKTVQTANAKPSVYAGMVYYFCSRDCRERFEAAPQSYLAATVANVTNEKETVHG